MPSSIAELATSVLQSFDLYRLPVNPFEIVRHEGILFKPGSYSSRFDARIEYYGNFKKYCIYYAEPGGWRTEGRVRFTIAHELGHYFIEEHRERLHSGALHNSVVDYRSRDPFEEQADEFAADLLMPMELFRREMKTFSGGFCTLTDLVKLANKLGTSITSTARRYCDSDCEGCTIYFSEAGNIRWGRSSEDMKRTGMYWYEFGTPPPSGSLTAKYWEMFGAGERPERLARQVNAEVWFSRPGAEVLWEEVMPLGNTGRVITQLTPHE